MAVLRVRSFKCNSLGFSSLTAHRIALLQGLQNFFVATDRRVREIESHSGMMITIAAMALSVADAC